MVIEESRNRVKFYATNYDKGGCYSLYISLPAKLPYSMRFGSESIVNKITKCFRIVDEIQTGDDQFDRAVYIYSDQPETKILLQNQFIRKTIERLITLGFKIEISSKRICLSIRRGMSEREILSDHNFATNHEQELVQLRNELELKCPHILHDRERLYFWKFSILFASISITAIWLYVKVISEMPIITKFLRREAEGLMLFLFICGMFLMSVFNRLILGARSKSHINLAWLLIPSGFLVSDFTNYIIPYWNVAWDRGSSRIIETHLEFKQVIKGRNGTDYMLHYVYYDPYINSVVRHVTFNEFEKSQQGETLKLEVHPGYFGLSWFPEKNLDR